MRVIVLLCLLMLTFGLRNADAQVLNQTEFDARLLSFQEKRIVQAALAFSGDYNGLLDGAWGKASQRSLERYTLRHLNTVKPAFADLHDLLQAFEVERRVNGWRIVYTESSGISSAFPDRLLSPDAAHESAYTSAWISADGRFSLVLAYGALNEALTYHDYAYSHARAGTQPYQSIKPGRIVTSSDLSNGIFDYVRSDDIGAIYMTFSILAGAEHAGRVALMSGSIQRGRSTDLTLPSDGVLAAVLRPAPTPSIAKAPSIAEQPFAAASSPSPALSEAEPNESAPAGTPTGSGTGFYINNTDLVTAAHVVAGCAALKLADGSVLQVLAEDDALDLAALTSTRRSAVWLGVGASVTPKLGETVMALGYPYLGNLGQGLTATNGNISALQGIDGSKDRIMISAPVQPGNSGGPLINSAGGVVGVVVSRVNDMKILESTGTLPQNMNFAVSVQPLNGFLSGAGVMFPRSNTQPIDLGAGIPDQITAAVVPIYCYQ
ncbi:S1 family peptidase [Cypionkella psychrotolerans]|uniref:S1 family peptidase n=1 Tax=Cypionkella psychrotolerans TaxID=1678131 RepID=UPI000AB1A319|nr:serine protease [Cypionkella psychrotolerans]